LVDGEGVKGGEIHPPKVRRMWGGSTDECDRSGERLFFCRGGSDGGLWKGGERGELVGEFAFGGDVAVGGREGLGGFAESVVGGFGGGLGSGDFERGEAGHGEDGVIGAVVAGHGGAVVEESEFGALLFFVEVTAKVGEGGDEAGWEVFFEGRLEAPLFGGGGVDEFIEIGLQGLQVCFGEDGPAAEVVEVGPGEVTEDEGLGELTVHGGGEFGKFAEAFESSEVVKAGEGAVAVFPGDEGGVVVGEGGESGFGFGVVTGVEAGEGGAPTFGFLDIKFGDVGVEELEGIAALGGVADDEAIGFGGDEEAGVALAGGGNSHNGKRRGRGVKGKREGKSEKEEAHGRGGEGVEGRVALADAPDAFIGFVFGLGFDFEFFVEFLGAFDVRAGDGVLGLFIHARDGVFDEAEGFGFVALFEDNFGGADSSFCGVVDVVFERRGDEGGVGFEGFFEFALFLVGAGEFGEDFGAVAGEGSVGLDFEKNL